MDKTLSDLLEILVDIYKKQAELKHVGVDFDYLGHLGSKIEDIIMDSVGIPEDTTSTLGFEHPDCFCRDYYSDWIYKFLDDEITKEKLIFNLKNWKSL